MAEKTENGFTENITPDEKDVVIVTSSDDTNSVGDGLIYGIDERPPWLLSIILAIQHFSTNFTSYVVWPLLISGSLCMDSDQEAQTRLIASTFLVTGAGTVLQCIFGSRLPVLQGPSAAFFVPMVAMLQVRGECPAPITVNSTDAEIRQLRDEAYSRMQQSQGTLLFAALVQSLIGFTGLIGVILRFIGPITIGVAIFVIGIGITGVAMEFVEAHWCISIPTIALVIIFSMALRNVAIPFPGGTKIRIFALLPMSLAILIMWIVCAILTVAGVFPDSEEVYGYAARVDVKADNLRMTPWLSLPYPGQWGWPTFNGAGMLAVLSAVLASMMDSIGDYHACAQVGRAPPPPDHAVNRGIALEGIGVFLCGLFGTGVGVTSNSGDIAVINLTKVASRSVLVQSGIIFMMFAFFTKFSALVNGIPTPVLGAVAIPIAMISSIGLANFQHVNMNNSRNILVIGFSIFTAIGLPNYLADNPDAVNTGSEMADDLIVVLLSSGMFVGAVVSAFLDNVLPGSYEDRGMNWRTEMVENEGEVAISQSGLTTYDLPYGMEWIRKHDWTKRLPFSPNFVGFSKRRVHLGD